MAVLVLGGTAEGRELANVLCEGGHPVISSLAGRTAAPRLPAGPVRVGGFGGPDGLAEYLRAQRVSAVIDATHPFAARITANAALACHRTGTPLLLLRRPAWSPAGGDRWTAVPDLAAAAELIRDLDHETRVLLTTGRQGLATFAEAPQRFWLRSVDPPGEPRPARCELILDRGPFTVEGERQLLRELAIDLLVTKNSGGTMTAAKLTAARHLGLPVVIVDRPPAPAGVPLVHDIRAAVTWLTGSQRARAEMRPRRPH